MLVAHCHLRQAQRTFKLERIVQLRRMEEGGTAPTTVLNTVVPPVEEKPCPSVVLETVELQGELPFGEPVALEGVTPSVDGAQDASPTPATLDNASASS